jgi:hypothetical protein
MYLCGGIVATVEISAHPWGVETTRYRVSIGLEKARVISFIFMLHYSYLGNALASNKKMSVESHPPILISPYTMVRTTFLKRVQVRSIGYLSYGRHAHHDQEQRRGESAKGQGQWHGESSKGSTSSYETIGGQIRRNEWFPQQGETNGWPPRQCYRFYCDRFANQVDGKGKTNQF